MDKQSATFSTENNEFILGFFNTEYGHMVLLPEAILADLAGEIS
jgi:hypothetical protein